MSFDPDAVERFCTAAGLVVQNGRVELQPGLLADIVVGAAR